MTREKREGACYYSLVPRASLTQGLTYRIYSIKRPGRLFNFWTFRVGAYSRWALIRGWALNRINTVRSCPLRIIPLCPDRSLACPRGRKPGRIRGIYHGYVYPWEGENSQHLFEFKGKGWADFFKKL